MTPDLPDDVKRWTSKRRAAVVMAILKGETSAQEVARKYGLRVAEVENWKDRFEMGAENALRTKPRDENAAREGGAADEDGGRFVLADVARIREASEAVGSGVEGVGAVALSHARHFASGATQGSFAPYGEARIIRCRQSRCHKNRCVARRHTGRGGVRDGSGDDGCEGREVIESERVVCEVAGAGVRVDRAGEGHIPTGALHVAAVFAGPVLEFGGEAIAGPPNGPVPATTTGGGAGGGGEPVVRREVSPACGGGAGLSARHTSGMERRKAGGGRLARSLGSWGRGYSRQYCWWRGFCVTRGRNLSLDRVRIECATISYSRAKATNVAVRRSSGIRAMDWSR